MALGVDTLSVFDDLLALAEEYKKRHLMPKEIAGDALRLALGGMGGLNQYVFCGDNPVNYRDPDGAVTLPVAIVVSGVALSLVYEATYVARMAYQTFVSPGDPESGRLFATTLPGTSLIFRSRWYDELTCAGRKVIDFHEKQHSAQPLYYSLVSQSDILEKKPYDATVKYIDDLMRQGGLSQAEINELQTLRGDFTW